MSTGENSSTTGTDSSPSARTTAMLADSSDSHRAQTESPTITPATSLNASDPQEPSAEPSARGRNGSAAAYTSSATPIPSVSPSSGESSPSSPSLMKTGLIDHATAVRSPGTASRQRTPQPASPARSSETTSAPDTTTAIPTHATKCGTS